MVAPGADAARCVEAGGRRRRGRGRRRRWLGRYARANRRHRRIPGRREAKRENRGPAKSLNVGIEASRADWVAFLDDDDLWAPRKLATQLEAMEATGATWGYCAVATVDDRLEVVAGAEPPFPRPTSRRRCSGAIRSRRPSIVVVRRDELERMGGFDERLRHAHDWDLYLRLARAARAAACPEVLVAYVDHSEACTPGSPLFTYLSSSISRASTLKPE